MGPVTSVVTRPVEARLGRHPADQATADLAFILGEFQPRAPPAPALCHHLDLGARGPPSARPASVAGGNHFTFCRMGGGGSFGHGAGRVKQHIQRASPAGQTGQRHGTSVILHRHRAIAGFR